MHRTGTNGTVSILSQKQGAEVGVKTRSKSRIFLRTKGSNVPIAIEIKYLKEKIGEKFSEKDYFSKSPKSAEKVQIMRVWRN